MARIHGNGGARLAAVVVASLAISAAASGWAEDEGGGLSNTLKGAAATGASTALDESAAGADMGTAGKKGASAAMDEALGTSVDGAKDDLDRAARREQRKAKRAAREAVDGAAADANEATLDAVDGGVRRLTPMQEQQQ